MHMVCLIVGTISTNTPPKAEAPLVTGFENLVSKPALQVGVLERKKLNFGEAAKDSLQPDGFSIQNPTSTAGFETKLSKTSHQRRGVCTKIRLRQ